MLLRGLIAGEYPEFGDELPLILGLSLLLVLRAGREGGREDGDRQECNLIGNGGHGKITRRGTKRRDKKRTQTWRAL